MTAFIDLALTNLLSPMVLFFALGFAAAMARSDLSVPEAFAKGLALYLLLSIGFKGGVEIHKSGLHATAAMALGAGLVLSFAMPALAYGLLRLTSKLDAATAAAVAAHYGSISVVTFVTASQFLESQGIKFEGFMVAVVAVMETPAIVSGLYLARRALAGDGAKKGMDGDVLREILLNGSVVVLVGAFFIGILTGEKGLSAIGPFVVDPFKGVLCLFLLDMGIVAATRLRQARALSLPVILFGLYMPVIGAGLGLAAGWLIGLSVGGTAVMAVLAASASYIAVPAALRLALPEANPAVYLTLSLAVTFPFNVAIGIPLYAAAAARIMG